MVKILYNDSNVEEVFKKITKNFSKKNKEELQKLIATLCLRIQMLNIELKLCIQDMQEIENYLSKNRIKELKDFLGINDFIEDEDDEKNFNLRS